MLENHMLPFPESAALVVAKAATLPADQQLEAIIEGMEADGIAFFDRLSAQIRSFEVSNRRRATLDDLRLRVNEASRALGPIFEGARSSPDIPAVLVNNIQYAPGPTIKRTRLLLPRSLTPNNALVIMSQSTTNAPIEEPTQFLKRGVHRQISEWWNGIVAVDRCFEVTVGATIPVEDNYDFYQLQRGDLKAWLKDDAGFKSFERDHLVSVSPPTGTISDEAPHLNGSGSRYCRVESAWAVRFGSYRSPTDSPIYLGHIYGEPIVKPNFPLNEGEKVAWQIMDLSLENGLLRIRTVVYRGLIQGVDHYWTNEQRYRYADRIVKDESGQPTDIDLEQVVETTLSRMDKTLQEAGGINP